MNGIMDTIMLVLFVLFMFFIFGGYHRKKFEEREEAQKRSEEGAKDGDADSAETKA